MSWQTITVQARIEAGKQAYAESVGTMSAMAAVLSERFEEPISRNVVAGMYDRHPEELKACKLTGTQPAHNRLRQQRAIKVRVPVPPPMPEPEPEPVRVAPPVKGSIPRPEPLLKRLFELERNHCRWPVEGEKADTLFCCHQVVEGHSYCEYHRRVSRGAGTISERRAA